jgi:hypothetical protein
VRICAIERDGRLSCWAAPTSRARHRALREPTAGDGATELRAQTASPGGSPPGGDCPRAPRFLVRSEVRQVFRRPGGDGRFGCGWWFTLASLETPDRGFLPRWWCGPLPRRPARSRGLRSPREGLREGPGSGFHHPGTTTWSRPLGERRPFRSIVPGRRRARFSRRPSGSPACGVVALPVARRRGPRRSLFGARPRGRLVLPPGIEVGPIEGEREGVVERTPAEPGHLEGPEDRLDRHRRGDLPADDPAPRGVEVRDVGHPFGGADVGEVRDRERVRMFRPKDPVNEVGGDVGTTASLSRHPSATLVARDPGHCHEPGDLVPPDVVAGFLGGDDLSVWIPCLRRAPARGPSQKRARRIRTACPLPEPTGAGGVPRCRCAGHESVRPMGSAELPVLIRSRMPAVSLEVTPGSSFADVRLSTYSGPTRPQSRASSLRVRSHRPLSRSRRQVARRGARRARSLRQFLSGGVARRRRTFRAPVAGPAALGCAVMALPPPTASCSRGTRRSQRGSAGRQGRGLGALAAAVSEECRAGVALMLDEQVSTDAPKVGVELSCRAFAEPPQPFGAPAAIVTRAGIIAVRRPSRSKGLVTPRPGRWPRRTRSSKWCAPSGSLTWLRPRCTPPRSTGAPIFFLPRLLHPLLAIHRHPGPPERRATERTIGHAATNYIHSICLSLAA